MILLCFLLEQKQNLDGEHFGWKYDMFSLTPSSDSSCKFGVCISGLFQETSFQPRSSARMTIRWGGEEPVGMLVVLRTLTRRKLRKFVTNKFLLFFENHWIKIKKFGLENKFLWFVSTQFENEPLKTQMTLYLWTFMKYVWLEPFCFLLVDSGGKIDIFLRFTVEIYPDMGSGGRGAPCSFSRIIMDCDHLFNFSLLYLNPIWIKKTFVF